MARNNCCGDRLCGAHDAASCSTTLNANWVCGASGAEPSYGAHGHACLRTLGYGAYGAGLCFR